MRIVHVITSPMSFVFIDGLLRFLQDHGHDVRAVSAPGPWPLGTNGPSYEHHSVAMTRSITPARDLAALVRLFFLFRSLRPVVVHTHTPKAGLLGTLAAFLARVPQRFYTLHGLRSEAASGASRALLATADRLACRLATTVHCVSPSLRKEVLRRGIASAARAKVLGSGSFCGVEAATRFDPDEVPRRIVGEKRRELGIPRGAPVVGFVGRITPDKGLEDLLDACEEVRSNFSELRLVLIGSSDGEEALCTRLSERIRESTFVHEVGFVRSTATYYAMMDVLALPSLREGFPLVLLEAASMGLPVVATSVTGCRDAVIDGVTGTLVSPRSPKELACALARYLADPQLRASHGSAGRRRALADFRPTDLYEAILADYGPPSGHPSS